VRVFSTAHFVEPIWFVPIVVCLPFLLSVRTRDRLPEISLADLTILQARLLPRRIPEQ